MTTKIFDNPRNENLAPAVNRKLEAGFDMTVSNIDLNVTLYSEKMENGFSFESYYENFIFNRYTQPVQNGLDLYFVPGSGYSISILEPEPKYSFRSQMIPFLSVLPIRKTVP
ncbi:MAG: hypothetical protein U5L72_16410 [Bacteroidales bacterium]|nr:hypothetical protein [Bacteroidales bacterium]